MQRLTPEDESKIRQCIQKNAGIGFAVGAALFKELLVLRRMIEIISEICDRGQFDFFEIEGEARGKIESELLGVDI